MDKTRDELIELVAVLELAIAEMTTAPPAYMQEMRDHGVNLSDLQARIYGRLVRSPGQWVRRDALYAAAYWDRHEAPESRYIISVHIHNIRKRFAEGGMPVAIRNIPWSGSYRAERTG